MARARGPVFVPLTLPGEVVDGEIDGDALTGIRIVDALARPGRSRPAPHARTCGGCLMQHAADAFVADWKQGMVHGALAAQGLTARSRPITDLAAASRGVAPRWPARRTKAGALIGFHARASDTLVAVPDCQLLHPDLIATFPALEALVDARRLAHGRGGADGDAHRWPGRMWRSRGGKPLDARCAGSGPTWPRRMAWRRLIPGTARWWPCARSPMQRFGRALVAPPPGGVPAGDGRGRGGAAGRGARCRRAGRRGRRPVRGHRHFRAAAGRNGPRFTRSRRRGDDGRAGPRRRARPRGCSASSAPSPRPVPPSAGAGRVQGASMRW